MLNRSDRHLDRAEAAESAQILRGGGGFGSVVYCENASFITDRVQVESGYGDCLPLLSGGFWRDPGKPVEAEVLA